MTVMRAGSEISVVQSFQRGRWSRVAQAATAKLREDETVANNDLLYALLLGLPYRADQQPWTVPLETPEFLDQTVVECGIRSLGAGSLLADRPVLINQRLVNDAIKRCEQAGTSEAGAAVLGKTVRLPEPLPGTTTRLVTVLSTLIEDARHQGASLEFAFSPDALAEAMEIADLRAMGETVQTVYHSHGWSPECAGCQENGTCLLPGTTPSLRDYQVLESLVSSKATLMPIAGRQPGTQQQRPVLRIFAWRGGEMQPIHWQVYVD